MISTATRRASVALAGLLVGLTAAPATASAPKAQPVGAVAGYENVYDGEAATIERFRIEGGDTVEALCIQFGVPMNDESAYTAVPRSETEISGIGRAAWVGANHAEVGTPLEDDHLEAVATQLAAWSFTDGLTYTEDNLNNRAARERVAELVAAAGSIGASTSTFSLDVEVERDDSALVATATLLGDGSAPLADETVTFTLEGSAEGTLEAVTDAHGKAVVSAPGVTGEGSITATFTGTLAAGSVLRPDNGGQLFVTTQPASIVRTDRASFAAVPAPEPEPTEEPAPEPTEEPAPEAEPEPTEEPAPQAEPTATPVAEELPFTGPEDVLVPLGIILAALGIAGYGYHLRRKVA